MADPQRNCGVAYAALFEKAMRLGEPRAIREREDVGTPPYADGRGYAVQRKWSNLFEGADFFIASMVGFALNAPDYRPHDISDWFDGQVLSAERLVPQTSATRRADREGPRRRLCGASLRLPGRRGFHHANESRQNLRPIRSRAAQAFVTIPEGGHFAVFMKRDAFLHELVARMLPAIGVRGSKRNDGSTTPQ